jgi:basic membrane protein A
MDGTLEMGLHSLGLGEDGVGYALDENNRELISAEMEATLEEAKAKIIAGEIEVTDYYSTQ